MTKCIALIALLLFIYYEFTVQVLKVCRTRFKDVILSMSEKEKNT